MARITIASLSATNERLTAERDFLLADRNRLVDEVAALKAAPAAPARRPAYVAQRSDAAQVAHDAYVRALLAARETAMRTGRSVRVG